jgi:hypothetical protein
MATLRASGQAVCARNLKMICSSELRVSRFAPRQNKDNVTLGATVNNNLLS